MNKKTRWGITIAFAGIVSFCIFILVDWPIFRDNLIAFLCLVGSIALFTIVYIYFNYEKKLYGTIEKHKEESEEERKQKEREMMRELRRKENEEKKRIKAEQKKRAEEERLRKKQEAAERRNLKTEEKRRKKAELELLKQRLNEYLLYAVKQDMDLKQIKESLISKGWPKDFIEKYCKKYFSKYKRIVKTESEKMMDDSIEARLAKINKELIKLR